MFFTRSFDPIPPQPYDFNKTERSSSLPDLISMETKDVHLNRSWDVYHHASRPSCIDYRTSYPVDNTEDDSTSYAESQPYNTTTSRDPYEHNYESRVSVDLSRDTEEMQFKPNDRSRAMSGLSRDPVNESIESKECYDTYM